MILEVRCFQVQNRTFIFVSFLPRNFFPPIPSFQFRKFPGRFVKRSLTSPERSTFVPSNNNSQASRACKLHSFHRVLSVVFLNSFQVLYKSTCPSRAVEGRCCAAASGTADALGEPAGVEAGGFAVDRTVARGVHRATARVSVGTSAVITTMRT